MTRRLRPLDPLYDPRKRRPEPVGNTPGEPPCISGYTDSFSTSIDPAVWTTNTGIVWSSASGGCASNPSSAHAMDIGGICPEAGYWIEVDWLPATGSKQLAMDLKNAASTIFFQGKLNGSNVWECDSTYNSDAGTASGVPANPFRMRFECYDTVSTTEMRLYSGAIGGGTPSTLRRSITIGTPHVLSSNITRVGLSAINAITFDNFAFGVI